MKKLIFNQYGGVDVLQMIEVEKPLIAKNTILIKTKAVSINPLDWKIRQGEMKIMTGSKFPKGLGIDFSGIVEAVGDNVQSYKQGDAVFGALNAMKGGALAEYLVVSENDIYLKPNNVSFEQAAAMPIVGSAALQIFDKLIDVKSGSEILINGATGGIGMFAVQMAKEKGLIVTAVASEKGFPHLQKWQADAIIDYKKENILDSKMQFDVVIDFSGSISFDKARKLMKPKAVYVNAIPNPAQMITSFIHNLFSNQKNKILFSKPTPLYLKALASYAENGMEVVIGKTYSFSDFKVAYTEVPKAGYLGKVVINIPD